MFVEDASMIIAPPGVEPFPAPFVIVLQTLFLQSKDLDAGPVENNDEQRSITIQQDSRRSKFVSGIILKVLNKEQTFELVFRIFHRNTLSEPRVLYREFIIRDLEEFTKVRVPGTKYISFEIEDKLIRTIWRMSDIQFEGRVGGSRR